MRDESVVMKIRLLLHPSTFHLHPCSSCAFAADLGWEDEE
jgi:hypothetical protein